MFTEPLISNKTTNPSNYMTSLPLSNDAQQPSIISQNSENKDDETTESKSSDVSINTPLKASEFKHNDHKNYRRSSQSLVRRLSTQFIADPTLHRQSSINNMTSAVSAYIPEAIANNIPGFNLNASRGELHKTYFCNICFTNYPLPEGFKLTNCRHMFCINCIKGFFTNKIINGRVLHIKCFFPVDEKACGIAIADEDIRQVVEQNVWERMQRYIANLENHLTRECPYCQHTQAGTKENPTMECEQCQREYCLYHSNAHPMSETCASYDLRMAKEYKLNEEAIGDAKPCPRCNFRIQKNGGCNHMKCVKCGCSFCWKCMQEIEDSELPNHYKEDGPCKGMQFDGMEGEPPPRWILAILVVCACVFFLPAVVLGAVFGLLFCPFAALCGCCNNDNGDITIISVFQGCFLGWLVFLIVIAIFIPLLVFAIIYEVLKLMYNGMRYVCTCLPACPEMSVLDREQHQQREQQQQRLWNDAVADYQNRNTGAFGNNSNNVVLDIDT